MLALSYILSVLFILYLETGPHYCILTLSSFYAQKYSDLVTFVTLFQVARIAGLCCQAGSTSCLGKYGMGVILNKVLIFFDLLILHIIIRLI